MQNKTDPKTRAVGYPTEITQMFPSGSTGFVMDKRSWKCSRPHIDFCREVIARINQLPDRDAHLHTEIVNSVEMCQVIDLGNVPFRSEG